MEYDLLVNPGKELPVSDWFKNTASQKTINDILSNSDVCDIKINGITTGFFTFSLYQSTMSFKLFLNDSSAISENQLILLLKDFCNENYKEEHAEFFTIAFFRQSKLLELNKFIDRTVKMEYTPVSKRRSESGFSIEINDNDLSISELKDFHYVCYSEDAPYMPGDWDKMLVNFKNTRLPSYTFSSATNGVLSGICIGMYIPHREFKYLYSICTHPEKRSTGIGSVLLESFLKAEPVKPVVLNVYESAVSACKLYRKKGFIVKSVTSYVYKG